MKNLLLILILYAMFLNVMSQNYYYDSNSKKKPFESEDIDILFSASSFKFPEKKDAELAPALISLLPSVVDVAFQLTSSSLENRVKKFTAEYSKQKSYLEAGKASVPNFVFVRTINGDDKALEISFTADTIHKLEGIIYYIDYIELNYSAAKVKKNKNKFDYSIELKPTFLINGEKKVQKLSPIVISSIKFGKTTFDKYKHRTDIIPLPSGAVFTELSIKIIETNPSKVRAEKILSIWNDNKESVKTIINNYLPEEDEKNKDDDSKEGGNNQVINNNASTGND